MSRLARGQAALIARLQASAAPEGPVTYTRAAGGTVDLTGKCWVGRTAFRRLPTGSEGEASVVWGDRDYLVPAAELGGEPARGDRFTEAISGVDVTFEVMTPDVGEPEWRYSDAGRTVYRIHTQRVSPEE